MNDSCCSLRSRLLTILGWTGESGADETSARRDSQLRGATRRRGQAINGAVPPQARGPGWVEGRTSCVRNPRAIGDPAKLAEAAAELTRLKVDVIFADSARSLRAARAATHYDRSLRSTLRPIRSPKATSRATADPEETSPGSFSTRRTFSGKWIEILQAIVPDLSRAVCCGIRAPGPPTCAHSRSSLDASGLQLQVDRRCTSRRTSTRHLRVSRTASGPDHPAFTNDVSARANNSPSCVKHRLPGTSMSPWNSPNAAA